MDDPDYGDSLSEGSEESVGSSMPRKPRKKLKIQVGENNDTKETLTLYYDEDRMHHSFMIPAMYVSFKSLFKSPQRTTTRDEITKKFHEQREQQN